MQPPPRLRIQVRNKLALQALDHVFEHQPTFFQAPQHDVIDIRVFRQVVDDVIQIAMFDPQISQSAGVLKRRCVNVLVHRVSVSGIA